MTTTSMLQDPERGRFQIVPDEKIIFAGPSIAGLRPNAGEGASIHPPCKQGDIFLASQQKPSVIAIIDGFFDGVPSVWHKEILWALSRGIHVVGAASMGALRAAETDRFGMIGVGRIYESYRDQVLEDDDEVALLHGPAEMGSVPLSLAMVNVRATLFNAVERGKITEALAVKILNVAKSQFYQVRTWDSLAAQCAEDLGKEAPNAETAHWLVENEVDQKKLDAQALFDFLKETDFSGPFTPDFTFEETEFWHQCTRNWVQQSKPVPRSPTDGPFRLFG